MSNDKKPPIIQRAEAAERAVIASLLLAPAAYYGISDTLKAEHFGTKVYSDIFGAIGELLMESRRCSLSSIETKVGFEYGDGLSTINLMTALLRDAQQDGLTPADFVDDILEGWRYRSISKMTEWAKKQLTKQDVNASDVLDKLHQRSEYLVQDSSSLPGKPLAQITADVIKSAIRVVDTGETTSISCGIPEVDAINTLLAPGDLGVIGGAPGAGKTILGGQMAKAISRHSFVPFIQLDMGEDGFATRFLSHVTNLSSNEIAQGRFDAFGLQQLRDAQAELEECNLYTIMKQGMTLREIIATLTRLKNTHPDMKVAFIDHLRLIQAPEVRDKWDRFAYITGKLKEAALRLGIAIVVLSQMTRQSQRNSYIPTRTGLDGGGSLDQDGDWILAIARKDNWLLDQRPRLDPGGEKSNEYKKWEREFEACKGKAEVHNLKNRRGPERGVATFWCVGKHYRLEPVDE